MPIFMPMNGLCESTTSHGAGVFIMQSLQENYPYLRVDTFEKNASMIYLLKKVGFKQCGVAYYDGFGDMITFDYLRPER